MSENQKMKETRLSANALEKILAELPSVEERERLLREIRDKGGLSSEEFLASLGLDLKAKP